jgi:hypothetical protein
LLRAGPRSSRARRKEPYLWSVPFHLAYADLPSPYQSSQANKSHFERAVRKLELKDKGCLGSNSHVTTWMFLLNSHDLYMY